MIKYVLGFVFNSSLDNVILIRKEHPAWQRGKYNGVGGKIETTPLDDGNVKEELSTEAMSREFFEETGTKVHQHEWKYFGTITNENHSLVHLYYCSVDDQRFHYCQTQYNLADGSLLPTDRIEYVNRYHIDKLPKNCIPNLHWLIPLALSGECVNIQYDYIHVKELIDAKI